MNSKKDWSKINRDLIARGSLRVWIPENIESVWYAKHGKRSLGRPIFYADAAIQLCLVLKSLLSKPLRQSSGFMRDLFERIFPSLEVPDYTTLSRRASAIEPLRGAFAKHSRPGKQDKVLDILLDSTGLKFQGPGHWLSRKKGSGRCKWIKLHLAVNAKTQRIEASLLTPGNVADCSAAVPLLEKVNGPIRSVTADGAYDSSKFRKTLWLHGIAACIPPQFNARLQKEVPVSQRNCTRTGPHIIHRDEAIEKIRQTGTKKLWMKESGYHKRSLVETAMGRFKGTFGGRISARNQHSISAEIETKIEILNRFIEQKLQGKSV